VATEWSGFKTGNKVDSVQGGIVSLAGNGDGTFQNLVDVMALSAQIPISIVGGDFNGDGRPDLAYTSVAISGVEEAVPDQGIGNLQETAVAFLAAFPEGATGVLLNTTPPSTFTNTNAAGFQRGSLAQDSIVTAFGAGLASATAQAAALSTGLGGVTVSVKDSTGTSRQADLFYVSPTQINYAMPAGTATGAAAITIASGTNTVTATQQIASVLPGIFAVNGVAAGNVETFQNGKLTAAALAFQVTANGEIAPLPIDVSSGQVYLLLYGTGIRHASSVTVNFGAQTGLPVAYAGAQGGYLGEDQINILLPQSLHGAGVIKVTLTADGQTSNAVQIQIK
jgi:uncharacterized protein (TIGR03437 family)